MMEALEKSKQESKPNFVINKKDQAAAGAPGGDKFANVAFARSEMNKTKEQLAEDKEIAISIRVKPLDIEGLSVDKLKQKAAQLWDLIVQLESDKYDLEERQKRQDYDVSIRRLSGKGDPIKQGIHFADFLVSATIFR
jgi:troponin T